MSTVAMSSTRVQDQTSEEINQRIRRQTQANVAYYARHPEQIDQRLRQLDREWDIERFVQTQSAALTLLGLAAAVTRNRLWLLAPIAFQSFFLQHAIQGWCPPIPMFRRFGVRTETEIQIERYALKMLRGDFGQAEDAESTLEAAQRA